MNREWIRHIDRLIQQRPAARSPLETFRKMALLMEQARPGAVRINVEKKGRDVQEEGLPLFSRADLPLDVDGAAALLKAFLTYLSREHRADSAGLKKALINATSRDEWPRGLFGAILRQDEKSLTEMGKKVSLDPMVLVFLGKTALRPFMERLRKSTTGCMDKSNWDKGCCPLCGSQPDMACLEKTGQRYLHCELCGEEWPYARLRCPFCNTAEQEKLGYFEAEEEEGRRVYFCRECHRYIKTIDKRVFEEPAPLELEGLATLHLDLLAREHGFK